MFEAYKVQNKYVHFVSINKKNIDDLPHITKYLLSCIAYTIQVELSPGDRHLVSWLPAHWNFMRPGNRVTNSSCFKFKNYFSASFKNEEDHLTFYFMTTSVSPSKSNGTVFYCCAHYIRWEYFLFSFSSFLL